LNLREPIGLAFVHRAHPKSNFYLRDLFNRFRISPLLKRMRYCIFIVFLKLKIIDIQRFKVVIEVTAKMRFT
jgi:hypothetical protein